jgi:hypothetical protein
MSFFDEGMLDRTVELEFGNCGGGHSCKAVEEVDFVDKVETRETHPAGAFH